MQEKFKRVGGGEVVLEINTILFKNKSITLKKCKKVSNFCKKVTKMNVLEENNF